MSINANRSKCLTSVFLGLLYLLFSITPASADPFEISKEKAVMTISRHSTDTIASSNITFLVKNISSSSVKMILLLREVKIDDDSGQSISRSDSLPDVSGIGVSNATDPASTYSRDFNRFTTLNPGQSVTVTVRPSKFYMSDRGGQMYQTYRPKTISFNGYICLIQADGARNQYAFSLTDIPVRLIIR